MTPEIKNYLERLLVITKDIAEPRGPQDAPSRYSLSYLFGYIHAAQTFIDALPKKPKA